MKRRTFLALGVAWLLVQSSHATPPELSLGAKASIGLYQPRVAVEVFTGGPGGQSLGPSSANSFLLDTGATSTLIFSSATDELKQSGYVVEGMIQEIGVSGVDEFDVSATYRLGYTGSVGDTEFLDDVRFLSTDTGSIDPTGLLGIHGIVGMPAMVGRVTTLDNSSTDGALSLSTGVSFSNSLPAAATHRFSVPLAPLSIPSEGDGPLPTSAPLSTLAVESRSGDRIRTDDLVLDTGAQMSIISQQMAFDLGLDANGNGDLSDDSQASVPIGGVGGTIQAPVLTVDELRVATNQGFDLIWQDAQVIVLDIDPRIAGVVGADLLTGDGGFDVSILSGLGGGLGDLGSLLGGDDGGLGDLLGGLLGGGDDGLGDLLGGLLGGSGGGDDLLGVDLGDLLGGDLLGGGLLGGDLGDLLGGDLGDGLGGGIDGVFGPLESHFDRVHFDFRGFPNGEGVLVFDVNEQISGQILNGDGTFDSADIDALVAAQGTADTRFDLDGDGSVGISDHELLVTEVFRTVTGDANLDQQVDFADFVAVAENFDMAGGWSEGDFDGNGRVEFADFTLMASHFGLSADTGAVSVPEPSGVTLALVASCLLLLAARSETIACIRP